MQINHCPCDEKMGYMCCIIGVADLLSHVQCRSYVICPWSCPREAGGLIDESVVDAG